MPAINVLPKNLADLIAAGEVVECPASVIKEFVENSIDAGATSVVVEIGCGGKTFIRVTDNGCGIERGDVKKAFLSHATSKIKTADDLDNISTLGFRGEALASVCAVSRVEMLTKPEGEEFGTRYVIEGGEELLTDDAGCPKGTTLIVRDLFYNVPARMKFLKKDVQEGNKVSSVLERVALSHPEISFRFLRDGKLQFLTPGDGELKSAVYAVFGREFSDSLAPVSYSQDGITVTGFTSKPAYGQSSRAKQVFFVNKRYVKIPVFITALETAYKNAMLVGKFPPCVLFLEMPYSAVDVNVHPAKTEVRFSDEKRVFDCIYRAVLGALGKDTTRPQVSFSNSKIYSPPKDEGEQLSFATGSTVLHAEAAGLKASSSEKGSIGEQKVTFKFKEYGNPITGRSDVFRASDNGEKAFDFLMDEYMKPKESVREYTLEGNGSAEKSEPLAEETLSLNKDEPRLINYVSVTQGGERLEKHNEEPFKSAEVQGKRNSIEASLGAVPEFRIIGEAFKTYIFAELSGKLILVDKHAAHERIIFNRLKENASSSQQLLLQPQAVRLSAEQYEAVLENLPLLYDAGYDISDFGVNTVKVSACPVELVNENLQLLIEEIAQYLSMNIKTVMPEKLDWIYHSAACRAAVKAGNDTSLPEMEELVRQLLIHDEIKCCPHGRPVAVEISKNELEKYFKRIV